jgi:malonyl-CoA O-methyltransferase
MLRGVFITGTDTGVGKTLVSAALMHRYRHIGNLRYWKPIQTGIEQDDDTNTVRRLGACRESELLSSGFRLAGAVAPYLAADLHGVRISISKLRSTLADEPAASWIVEGAGGVMVPVNSSQFMVDLMMAFSMPVIVAARSTLGTINHTLLTLEALRSRKLTVAGVVMCGDKNDNNRVAIEKYGAVDVLATMPRFETLAPEMLNLWSVSNLDRDNHLARFLS